MIFEPIRIRFTKSGARELFNERADGPANEVAERADTRLIIRNETELRAVYGLLTDLREEHLTGEGRGAAQKRRAYGRLVDEVAAAAERRKIVL